MNKRNIDTAAAVIHSHVERGSFSRGATHIHAIRLRRWRIFGDGDPEPRANERAGSLFYNGRETRALSGALSLSFSLSSPQRIICLDLAGSILSSYCFATGGYLLWRGFVGVHFPPG